MSYYIKINTVALKNDSKKIDDLVRNAEKELQEVYTAMKELDATWDGPANEAFNQQFAADYENFKNVVIVYLCGRSVRMLRKKFLQSGDARRYPL